MDKIRRPGSENPGLFSLIMDFGVGGAPATLAQTLSCALSEMVKSLFFGSASGKRSNIPVVDT
jgi:hypothetical protein